MKFGQLKDKLQIFKNKFFILGLILKFICLFSFGSEYLHNYFIPFIDKSLINFGQNPWSLTTPDLFPYGGFLYLVLAIPKGILYFIFGESSLGSTALSLFGIKLSLLFFDTVLFLVLSRWTQSSSMKIICYYWLNPILFYITYIYGQLDVVSMSLCFVSLFLTLRNNLSFAAFFFGLALSSKFHVAILIPFIAAFIWNRFFLKDALIKLIQSSLITGSTFVLGFLPLYLSSNFNYATTGSPEAQRIFSAKLIFSDDNFIFIGLLLLFLALGRLIFSTKITNRGLIYGSGFLLGILLLITSPMPGWYYWILPFMALFYVHYPSAPKLLLIALIFAYFNYFIVADFIENNSFYRNLSLTVMQTVLLSILLLIYYIAVKKESPLRNRIKPLLIGLAGDSGAGKNHLSQLIENILGSSNCEMIEGDNYHKWERGNSNWESMTHLNPKANNLSQLHVHAKNISEGQTFEHKHYDHETGKFTEPSLFNPAKTIIVQGLHSLYLKGLREALNLKIFLNPSESVRLYWKVKRDVQERGHTMEKVLSSMEKRKTDSTVHIQPQKDKSDWIIEIDWDGEFSISNWKENQTPSLNIKYTMFNDEHIDLLIATLQNYQLNLNVEYPEDGKDRVIISIGGYLNEKYIKDIAYAVFPEIRSLTRNRFEPKFASGYDGIHQLFLLCLLKKRLA